MFFYNFMFKCMENSYFDLFQRKSLPMNDFELTVPYLLWFSIAASGSTGGTWGVLVLLKFQVNSQKLGVQAPQNLEFE